MTARYFFWPSLSTVVLGFAIIGIYLLQKHFSDGADAFSSTAASRWTQFLQFAFSSDDFLCSEGRDMVNGIICLSLAAPWLQSKQPLNLRLCAWETQAVTLLVILSSRRSIVGSFFYLEASGECLTDSVVMMLQPIFECFKKAVFFPQWSSIPQKHCCLASV